MAFKWSEKKLPYSENENPVTEHIEKHIKCDYSSMYKKNKEDKIDGTTEREKWINLLDKYGAEDIDKAEAEYNSKKELGEKKSKQLYNDYKKTTEKIADTDFDVLKSQGCWFCRNKYGNEEYSYNFGYNVEINKFDNTKCDPKELCRLKLCISKCKDKDEGIIHSAFFVDFGIKWNERELNLEEVIKVFYAKHKNEIIETNNTYVNSSLKFAQIYNYSEYALLEYYCYLVANDSGKDSIERKVFETVSLLCKAKELGSSKPDSLTDYQQYVSDIPEIIKNIIEQKEASYDTNGFCFSEEQFGVFIEVALFLTACGKKNELVNLHNYLEPNNNHNHLSDYNEGFSSNALLHFMDLLKDLI